MLFIHYVRESLQKGMLVGAFEELSDMEWKLLAGLSPPDPMKGDRVMLYAPSRKVFNTCSRPRARAVTGGPPMAPNPAPDERDVCVSRGQDGADRRQLGRLIDTP
jgi:hypothetical protein